MVYLRPYLTLGVFRHGLRLCLAVGLLCHGLSEAFISQLGVLCHGLSEVVSGSRNALSFCHGLSEAVSDSRNALSWSI